MTSSTNQQEKPMTRMQMTNRFIVRSMCATTTHQPEDVTARELMEIAAGMPEVFPEGLTRAQAQRLLDLPDELVTP